ncbi:MAG: peptide ABC transporter substrate-binding protein [Anaerolineae bacterium]
MASPTAVRPTTPTPDPTQEAENRINTLDYPMSADPGTLDPAVALSGDIPAQDAAGMLFARLTRIDPATGEVKPWLAKSWTIDGQTVRFTLRDDIPWVRYNPSTRQVEPVKDADGKPRKVQASDVVFAVRRALNPLTTVDNASLLYVIDGGREYNTQPGADAQKLGVRAVDATTVEFKTTAPAAYLPALASLSLMAPVPQFAVEPSPDKWTDPANIVTSGPYALADWTRGRSVTLVRNSAYPDRDKVNIERLRFPIVSNGVQAYTLFTNNNLDSVPVPEGEKKNAQADTSGGRKIGAVPEACTTMVGFTTDKLPMDKPEVRKALAAATDRQALAAKAGNSEIATGRLIPAGVLGASAADTQGIPYDPAAAKRYLADAGYPDGKGFPTLTYAYNTCEACQSNKAIAEALRDMWQSTLGIQVKLESLEWSDYLKRINPRTPVDQMPHAWRLAWCQDYPDAANWLYDPFYVNSPSSYSRSLPGRFDDLVTQAAGTADRTQRADLYRQAEAMLLADEARIVPLYSSAVPWATQPWLKRTFAPTGGQYFDEWQLDWAAKRKALGR